MDQQVYLLMPMDRATLFNAKIDHIALHTEFNYQATMSVDSKLL